MSAFIGVGRRLHEENAGETADMRRWPRMGEGPRAGGGAPPKRGRGEAGTTWSRGALAAGLIFWLMSAFIGVDRRLHEENEG